MSTPTTLGPRRLGESVRARLAAPGRLGRLLAGGANLLWLVPAVGLVAFSLVYPMLQSIYVSFFDWRITDFEGGTFNGLHNFARIAGDLTFRTALFNTAYFAIASVVVSFVLGLLMAVLLTNIPWGAGFRALLLAPWVVPGAAVGLFFVFFFDQEVGLFNLVLSRLHVGPTHFPWLSTTSTALPAVVGANVWASTPFFMLMFAAALTGIPNELREAMRVDGASSWRIFIHLTLPYLRNVMVVASLIAFVRNINSFGLLWTMTQGGPVDATTTLALYVYRLAFQEFNFGYSSAVGVVWLVIVMSIATLYIRLLRRERLE